MAKDVKFTIKLNIDGKEHVVDASTDVKKLADELGIAKTKSDELRNTLLRYNNVTLAFQNLMSGRQQITGLMQQYTAASAVQQEAETKLATNMRNTMGARDEDIQSIKDLCAAQQQLGVIGDEVQLAGAQELATYLEKKSSLEKLIPVMNDMVAQQYGLNATQESAANIATMLGKVMDGQVGALSRYGYKFDEAQAQILKFGTEEQRVAVLAEVVESAVGGMNEALAKTDAGRAKQAANDFGDLKEKIGEVFASLEPAIIHAGQLSLAFNALGTSIGGIKGMIKAINLLSVTTLAATAKTKVAAVVQALWNKQLYYGKVAMYAWTFGAKLATVQAIAMRAAILGLMAVTGIGIAFAAVASVISLFSGKTDEATEAMKKAEAEAKRVKDLEEAETSARNNAVASLELNIAKLKDFHGSKQQEKKIVEEMNNTYGETMGYFDSVAKWYKALTANSEAYCRQMVIEAKTRMLANQIAEKEAETHSLIYDERGNKRTYSKTNETERRVTYQGTTMNGQAMYAYEDVEKPNTSEWAKVSRQVNDNRNAVKGLQKQMQEAVKEAATLDFKVKGSTARPTAGGGGGKTDKKDKVKAPAIEGSIDWYEERLQEIHRKITETSDETLAASLQSDYRALESELKEKKIRVGLEKPDKAETKTYLQTLQDQLAEARAKFDNATTVEARVDAVAEIGRIQAEIDEATNGRVTISAEVQPAYIETGSDADKRQSYANAQQRATRIQQDYEIGIIGKDEALRQIAELNLQLEKLGMKPVEIEVMTEDIDAARERMELMRESFGRGWNAVKGVGSGIEELSSALEGNGNAWQTLTGIVDGFIQVFEGIRAVVQIIDALTGATQMQAGAEAIHATTTKANTAAIAAETGELGVNTAASLTNTAAKSGEAIAGATASGASMPFPYNLVAIAAGVAAVIAAIAQIGSFATGGIVGGGSPSGDRLLARVNSGEMILNKQQQARLFKLLNGGIMAAGFNSIAAKSQDINLNMSWLQSQLQPIEIHVSGSLKGRGRDLVATIEEEQSHNRRS